jgi:UDP-perosamine 4-acetyltransferase
MSSKKRPCLLIGSGGHARVVLSILKEESNKIHDVIGILDLQTPKKNEKYLDASVIDNVDAMEQFCGTVPDIFLSIGDNAIRKKYFELGKSLGFIFPNLISEKAFISPEVILGQGNLICHNAYIGCGASVGDNNILNTSSILEHESCIGNHCHLAPASVICGRSRIDDQVFVGAAATIVDYIKIISNTVIGAGAVVVKDIETPFMVHMGVPAEQIERL